MDSEPSDDGAVADDLNPYDELGRFDRTEGIDRRAARAARAVRPAPLEADEQVVFDKIKSGALKGSRLNAMTGEMEPMDFGPEGW